MPLHKGCKSRHVTTADVVFQQLPIGPTRTIPQKHRPAKVLDDTAHLADRHALSLVGATVALHLTTTARRRFDTLFLEEGRRWPANQRLKPTGAAILVFRASTSLQTAPAAWRSVQSRRRDPDGPF